MTKRLVLPDPKIRRTWAQQLALERVDSTTFRSTAGAPYGDLFVEKNGEQRPRAFGGHVYAQVG
jgi:hypothetical protein